MGMKVVEAPPLEAKISADISLSPSIFKNK
ncbi:hypothetical protein VQ7734_01151 [Vibrio quintilis]|uniref:Uncharacterized protein n=1 Tax=Vibrio quintilis TaxID=1117707 RepID=A0A1M7YS45_9VIBR|nr:hypothetical protein VQ7734_01151 [Vibrio quintilis]